MSDPTLQTQTQPQQQDIGQQIASAPEKIWKRIRDALKVQTRQQAVQLVGQDQAAAEAARTILATSTEDILTRRQTTAPTLLAASRKRAPSEVMYGKGAGGLTI